MSLPEPRSAVVKNGILSWREQGAGQALVFIHGIGGSSESWAPAFHRLSSCYRVLAWDAPGYGGSEPPAEGELVTAADYAARLSAILDIRGIDRAHVIAHSIGSPIAAALALLGKLTAASLTLVHPLSGFGGLQTTQRDEMRLARLADIEGRTMEEFGAARAPRILGRAAAAATADEVARVIASVSKAGYRAMVEVMAEANLLNDLGRLSAPALVIAGAEDAIAPPAACRAIADLLPRASFHSVEGVGHYLPLEKPSLFLDLLEDFVSRQGAGRPSSK